MNTPVNNYNIIVLGPSGSGKTVFLASMYKKLSTQDPDITFSIETNAAQRKMLIDKYFELATSAEWPRSTGYDEISEWLFTCMVRPPKNKSYVALQFTYLDYAGGRITDLQDDDVEEDTFEKRLVNADVLLGILDGQKIYALMQGRGSANRFVYNELPNLLNIMAKSNHPIHFIITKWDILEARYTLAEIRERLLLISEFKNLVSLRIKECRVRLIPVSSVGVGFAHLQEDGSMKKTGKEPDPLRVEVPLCCVLPDAFLAELNQLSHQETALGRPVVSHGPTYTFWDKIGVFTGKTLRSVKGFLRSEYQLEDAILDGLIRYVESSARSKEHQALQEQNRLLEQQKMSLELVRDQQTAMKHAVDAFLYRATKLDVEFPESDLSR